MNGSVNKECFPSLLISTLYTFELLCLFWIHREITEINLFIFGLFHSSKFVCLIRVGQLDLTQCFSVIVFSLGRTQIFGGGGGTELIQRIIQSGTACLSELAFILKPTAQIPGFFPIGPWFYWDHCFSSHVLYASNTSAAPLRTLVPSCKWRAFIR